MKRSVETCKPIRSSWMGRSRWRVLGNVLLYSRSWCTSSLPCTYNMLQVRLRMKFYKLTTRWVHFREHLLTGLVPWTSFSWTLISGWSNITVCTHLPDLPLSLKVRNQTEICMYIFMSLCLYLLMHTEGQGRGAIKGNTVYRLTFSGLSTDT